METICPVKLDYEKALRSAREFERAVRKLRRSLRSCDKCAALDDCPVRKQIGQAIDEALFELNEEWRRSA